MRFMSKGFGTQVNPEKEFSDWFFRHYRRLHTTSLSDSFSGEAVGVDVKLKVARQMPGCYWLAQQWPRVPNKKTILNVYQRGKLSTLADLNDLILRSPDADDIRQWARDHADPAFACACC